MNSENVKEEILEETVEKQEEKKDSKKDKKEKKEVKNKYKEENELLLAEIENLKAELLLNRADLQNFQKRMKEEQIKDRKYASINLVTNLIGPIEYLEKAANMKTDDATLSNFLIGFQMISNQLLDVLKQDGLTQKSTLGEAFDPAIHHAIEKVSKEGVEPNIVVEEASKCYMYKDRVVKPAMVKVSE